MGGTAAEPPPIVQPAKSMPIAVGMSVGTTAVGALMFATAYDTAAVYVAVPLLLVGPTLGRGYAGEAWSPALGLRLGGALTAALGAITYHWIDFKGDADQTNQDIGLIISGIGGAVFGIGAVIELATTPGAVNRANARAASLTYTVVGPDRAPGLALVGTF
jgi:hypothetical protein